MRGKRGRLDVGDNGVSDGLGDGGRDFTRASKWFMRVAKTVWPKDPRDATAGGVEGSSVKRAEGSRGVLSYDPAKDVKLKTDDHYTLIAGLSAGFLGRLYLRGEGVRTDYAKAFLWFMRGSSQVSFPSDSEFDRNI